MNNKILLFIPALFLLISCNSDNKKCIDRANYQMSMVFDSTERVLSCRMNIKWCNTSPELIKEIPFRFKQNSSNSLLKEVSVDNQPAEVSYASSEKEGFDGFILKLNKPLKNNDNIYIDISFTTVRKSYYPKSDMILFDENFPMVAYFENGKFIPQYQVHADYKVDITFPEEFKIATTGMIITEKSQDGMTVIHTSANEVPSYGVVFFRKVNIIEATVDDILIRSFYYDGDEKLGKKYLEHAEDVIRFYIDTLGFYPQPVLSLIPGYIKARGGWAVCPNIAGIHRGIDVKKTEAETETYAHWITAHEIGHMYWGYNYILEPLDYPFWFGIGMGIHTDRLYSISRNVDKDYNDFFKSYPEGVSKGYNTTIMQTLDTLDKQEFPWVNVIEHSKSYSVLRMLAYEIGEDTFSEIFKYCLNNYKGVNVTPEIFKRDCERISNKNLDEFFHTWLYTNDYLEYRIENVQSERKDNYFITEITISRVGKATISHVELAVLLENGETIYQKFDGKEVEPKIEIQNDSPVKEVILDPNLYLPLINRLNWNSNN